jgi:hypothetical protein
VRAGVADIFLPAARSHLIGGSVRMVHGLFIEMKKPADKDKKTAAGRQSDKQAEFELHVTREGYQYNVCYTWEEARDVIVEYLG